MSRRSCIVPAALVVVLAITACGSSGGSHRPANATVPPGAVRYADCMRSNGVPNFPDTSDAGGGLVIPNDINTSSPAFQTAQRACQSLMPGPGAHASAGEQQRESLLGVSRCMRAHGVSGFPDPVSSPPANPDGFAMAFGYPGAYIAVPDALNPRSPAFRQAAGACGLPGRG
jgi:hypothetical protein